MPIDVTDVRSNENDQIYYAAKKVGTSKIRQKVFEAICRGKQKVKTITEIKEMINEPRKRVLEEAIKLHNFKVLKQVKGGTNPAYEKDSFFCQHTKKILSYASDPSKLAKLPTKVRPKITGKVIKFTFPRKNVKADFITIDEIDSFKKVKKISESLQYGKPIYEKKFKNGMRKILGEIGSFRDWGGETEDLYSFVKIDGKRLRAAFSFKGIATKGILTPKKMGKNADQIQRLFRSPADLFMVQYWGQIDRSIIEQMESSAQAKSAIEGRRIYFGVIDHRDSYRLFSAFRKFFK